MMSGLVLLAGLPEKYASMIKVLEHCGILITTDSIKFKLLDMMEDNSSVRTGGAFTGSTKFKTYGRGTFKKSLRDGSSNNNINDSID